jgi:hypothetical protein
MSGNFQKMMKNDNQRSRINKMGQNYSMFEKFGPNGASPEKTESFNPNVDSRSLL